MQTPLSLLSLLLSMNLLAQNVGINTSAPRSRLHVIGTSWFQGDNTPLPASAGMGVAVGMGGETGYVYAFDYASFTPRNLSLQVAGGNVGIGSSVVTPGYKLDVTGPVRVGGDAAHFLANATGGTNSWARYYMRSSAQSWFIGTSQNFNFNQFYLVDESTNHTRLTIQPSGGPIYITGNLTQEAASLGVPKAMVYLNSNGTIGRCFSGVTGNSGGGCNGLTSVRVSAGNYQVNFPFDITYHYFAVTPQFGCCAGLVAASYNVFGTNTLNVGVMYIQSNLSSQNPVATDFPLMILVY